MKVVEKILIVLLNENLFFTPKEKVHFNEGIRLWYKPKCITFIPLYLVFCYLLCVNWVNNIAFHDLSVKYGQKAKNMQKRYQRKMVILHQNKRSRVLNPWWILSVKDQTLKFWWFWDCFEGVWNEKCEGHFGIILEEIHFWQFWPSNGIFGITK